MWSICWRRSADERTGHGLGERDTRFGVPRIRMIASQFERLREIIAKTDPDVISAIDEVDMELLRWSLSLSPWQRLGAASTALRTLRRFRRVPSTAGGSTSAD
jgi:hypothetical protein